jgi:hypothetical protein
VLSAGSLAGVVAAFTGVGIALLVLAILVRGQALIPWSVLAIAVGYLIGRVPHSTVDSWSAAVGVLLLVAAELAAWSIEHDARFHAEGPVVLRRTVTLASLALAAAVLDVAALGASGLSGGTGVIVAALGVAAAVGAIGLIARLARTG